MDLVIDLSNDIALAVFVEESLRQKLVGRDAKSFIAAIEAELTRISLEVSGHVPRNSVSAGVSH
jgi:hypothetical protein